MLTPNMPSVGDIVSDKVDEVKEAAKEKVKETTKETAKDLNDKAPDIFFDPNDKKDKEKAKKQGENSYLYNKFKEKYGVN